MDQAREPFVAKSDRPDVALDPANAGQQTVRDAGSIVGTGGAKKVEGKEFKAELKIEWKEHKVEKLELKNEWKEHKNEWKEHKNEIKEHKVEWKEHKNEWKEHKLEKFEHGEKFHTKEIKVELEKLRDKTGAAEGPEGPVQEGGIDNVVQQLSGLHQKVDRLSDQLTELRGGGAAGGGATGGGA